MKKKIEIVMDGKNTKIKTENMSLGDLAKALIEMNPDECVDDCDDCDDTDDTDYDDDDYDAEDRYYDDDDYEEAGNSRMRMMNGMMKEKIDIVAAAGFNVVAKILSFTYEGVNCYGIEVTPAVNGVTKMPEYALDVNDDGTRAVVQNGNGTLIVPYPIFRKPIADRIELEDCSYTGEVVTCEPGEDSVKGISALVELLKTKI